MRFPDMKGIETSETSFFASARLANMRFPDMKGIETA